MRLALLENILTKLQVPRDVQIVQLVSILRCPKVRVQVVREESILVKLVKPHVMRALLALILI